jgi:hypothetical protein
VPQTSVAWGDLGVFTFSDGVSIYGREFQILPSGTMFDARKVLAGVIGFTASRAAPAQWSVAMGDPLMVYGIRGTDPAELLPYYSELVELFEGLRAGRQAAE